MLQKNLGAMELSPAQVAAWLVAEFGDDASMAKGAVEGAGSPLRGYCTSMIEQNIDGVTLTSFARRVSAEGAWNGEALKALSVRVEGKL